MSDSKTERKMYPIQIPVKPHVKQFLIKNYGENLELKFNNPLGVEIYTLLSKKIVNNRYNLDPAVYSSQYTIYVGKHIFFDFGRNSITAYQASLINNMILDRFDERFIEYVLTLSDEGVTHKDAILRWCEKYQLDEGSTDWYQTLGRKLRRAKEKIKEPSLNLSADINTRKHTLAS